MAILKLPQDPRTAVFRLLVKTLKNDPILQREIKTWLVWDQAVTTMSPLQTSAPASIRLTPAIGPQALYTPDSNLGLLQVTIETKILSWDADDHLNLWGAVERAIYPSDRIKELAIEQTFRDAGAETGRWEFSRPFVTQGAGGEEGLWECTGMIQLEVIRTIHA